MLRLTPRNHDGQYVVRWRIEVSTDCRLDQHEDAFGNITHVFTAEGPLDELTVTVEGEVETHDTAGHRARRRSSAFRRASICARPPSPAPDDGNREFAPTRAKQAGGDTLELLHALLDARSTNRSAFDTDPTHAATTGRRGLRAQARRLQDLTHIFIAAARGARHSGALYRRISCAAVTASSIRRPAMPGRRPSCRASAGSRSIQPTGSARPTPMSASPSGSTISAPRRCAGPAMGGGRRNARRCDVQRRPGDAADAELTCSHRAAFVNRGNRHHDRAAVPGRIGRES